MFLRCQPGLCFGGRAEDAHYVKIPLGWNLEGFQHADQSFSYRYDGTGAELDLS
jgi:hypothetical protein